MASESQRFDTPLPELDPNRAGPVFQEWHKYDAQNGSWNTLERGTSSQRQESAPLASSNGSSLRLVTWNVDGVGARSQARIQGVLSKLKTLDPCPDIIFFQEVSKRALHAVLNDPWIQENWYTSEKNENAWEWSTFATMTLMSRSRFAEGATGSAPGTAHLGAVWRLDLPSRFSRDALCCDVHVPAAGPSGSGKAETVRVRLVNVHLDSLALKPSLRPRQLVLATSLLRSADRGLVAGDFNPVMKEDLTLVEENGLVDAWKELHPEDPGFTWGIDGKQPYPPGRLDKVALLGLGAREMRVLHPGMTEPGTEAGPQELPWSDHSGLVCSFGIM